MIDTYAKTFITQVDHHNLNDIIPNPTAENLAIWFLEHFQQSALGQFGLTVKLWETPKCWVEVTA